MIKAGKTIKILYSKFHYLTCLVYVLHRVAEEIRGKFPELNDLISNFKKIFLKLPYRIQHFKSMEKVRSSIAPEPILTM